MIIEANGKFFKPTKCHACGGFIEKGQTFVVVNTPKNEKARVHVKCLQR